MMNLKPLNMAALALACCIVFLGAFSIHSNAFAQARSNGIAAVVNEDVITFSDIASRLKLIMASSGIPDTKQSRDRLRPQILNMLIDEQIKFQEAERLSIEVTEEEIDQGFAQIAEQNKIPVDTFKTMIQKGGLKMSTLRQQIKAEVAWGKVVTSQIRSRVQVTDADVDSELDRIKQGMDEPQFLASEIFLSVNSPAQDETVQKTAQDLAKQVKANTKIFGQVAQQFSNAPGAAQGGDMGWVRGDQVQAEVEAELMKLEAGSVAGPIRTASGYHIVLLRAVRSVTAENLPEREVILQRIGTQRLGRQAIGYLQDLKSSAFIETRV